MITEGLQIFSTERILVRRLYVVVSYAHQKWSISSEALKQDSAYAPEVSLAVIATTQQDLGSLNIKFRTNI